jgi:hypothetical protein
VRTLQEFLVTARWDHDRARDTLQAHLGSVVAGLPADPLGTVGVVDETSCRKWGEHMPGVQRQYLGCVGKVDSGIVTVHLGVARGRFQALLDADLYLPKGWAADRPRCRAAGIPDDVKHRAKWRLAVDQWVRLSEAGVSFDWLVFDEGYGSKVPFLRFLNLVGQHFVAEVPVNFTVRDAAGGPARRADGRLSAADARGGSRHRVAHRTVRASFWRATAARVWVAEREHTLVVAINEATAEVKYFVTNATGPLGPVKILVSGSSGTSVAVNFRAAWACGPRTRSRSGSARPSTPRSASSTSSEPRESPGTPASTRSHHSGTACDYA